MVSDLARGTVDRTRLEAYGRRLCAGEGGVFHFPIRHHSPACALHLARAFAEIRPRVVVIEMPADFSGLLPLVLDPETRPPVALVALGEPAAGDVPSVMGYWPLSATAPEFVALRLAAALDARIVLADLPTRARLTEDQAPETGPVVLTDEHALAFSDYARGLVARVGARDFNETWDRLFEARAAEGDWRAFFADVGAHCALGRLTTMDSEMAADGTLARESFMRASLAQAVADAQGATVAVVTGGFHTPALVDIVAPPPLAAEGSAKTYLVRYAHASLDRINGYAAGMPSPRYYERLHASVEAGEARPFEAVATEMLLGLAARLRRDRPGFAPPLPSVIAALEQARGLAALRGLAGPGRCEILDAARSCFLKDEDPRFGSPLMEMLHRELAGEGIGDVPRGAGSPPLVEAVRARARALGFKVEDGQERRRELDIHRKDRHRAASRFLHAMALLETGFGRLVKGPDWTAGLQTGILFEAWTCAWSPPVEGRLVALSGEGDSLEQVAMTLLRRRAIALSEAGESRDSAAAARLVLVAAQAGIAAAQGALLPYLAEAIATDPDFARVVACLGTLDGLWSGRRVLGLTGAPALEPLRKACYRRAIDLMPNLADAAPERVAAAASALAGLGHILDTGGAEFDREVFDEAVAALLARALPPLIEGVVGALAHLAGRLDGASLADRVAGALAGAVVDPAERVAPLAGLILVQPALLRHCAAILPGIDTAFEAMDEADFLEILPHLRFALTALDPHETDDLAARIAAMKGIAGPLLRPTGDLTEAELLANAGCSRELEALLIDDGLGDWFGPPVSQALPA